MKTIAIAAAATFAMMSTVAFAGGPVLMTDEQLDQVVAGDAPGPVPPNTIDVTTGDAPTFTIGTTQCGSPHGGSVCTPPMVFVDGNQVTP